MSAWHDRDDFRRAVGAWAERLGTEPKEVVLRPMRRKWASCSRGGRLTFDLGLLSLDREFGEYVIVHELIHLKVPNHGPVFSALLGAYLPDWRERARAAGAERLRRL